MRLVRLWYRLIHSEWLTLWLLPFVIVAYVVLSTTLHLAYDELLRHHDFPLFLLTVQYFVISVVLLFIVFLFRDHYSVNYKRFWLDRMTLAFYLRWAVPMGLIYGIDTILTAEAIMRHSHASAEMIRSFMPCLIAICTWYFSLKELMNNKKLTAIALLVIGQGIMSYGSSHWEAGYLILAVLSTVSGCLRLVMTEKSMEHCQLHGVQHSAAPRFAHAYEVDSFTVDMVETAISSQPPATGTGPYYLGGGSNIIPDNLFYDDEEDFDSVVAEDEYSSAIRSIFDPFHSPKVVFDDSVDIPQELAESLVGDEGYVQRPPRTGSPLRLSRARRHHAVSLSDKWRAQMPPILLMLYFMPICLLLTAIGFFVFDLDRMDDKHRVSGEEFMQMMVEFVAVSALALCVYACEFYIISVVSSVTYVFCRAAHTQVSLLLTAVFLSKGSPKLTAYIGYGVCLVALALFFYAKLTLQSEIARDIAAKRIRRESVARVRSLRKEQQTTTQRTESVASGGTAITLDGVSGGYMVDSDTGTAYLELDLDLEDSLNAVTRYADKHEYDPAFSPDSRRLRL